MRLRGANASMQRASFGHETVVATPATATGRIAKRYFQRARMRRGRQPQLRYMPCSWRRAGASSLERHVTAKLRIIVWQRGQVRHLDMCRCEFRVNSALDKAGADNTLSRS